MNLPLIESETVAIKRAKKLKGSPLLTGDLHLAIHSLGLAILSEGETRIENLSRSSLIEDLLHSLQDLGYSQSEVEGHLLLEGGKAPKTISDAIEIHHEVILFVLGGILAAHNCVTPVQLSPISISRWAQDCFEKLFTIKMIAETPEGIRSFQVTGLRSDWRKALEADTYLGKIGLLYFHLAAKKNLRLSLQAIGPDCLEKMIAQFEGGLSVRKGQATEQDELSRRMARLKKNTSNQEEASEYILRADQALQPQFIKLSNDVGMASIYALAATVIPGSDLILEDVLLNSSRNGFISALRRMGADIEVQGRKEKFGEVYGTLRVKTAELLGRRFASENMESMREEIPLLILAAAFAEGETIIRDIAFLRTYHTDLLSSMIQSLKSVGLEIGEVEDGLVIRGRAEFDGSNYDSMGWPMLGFAYQILAMRSHGSSTLVGTEAMDRLYPGLRENLLSVSEA